MQKAQELSCESKIEEISNIIDVFKVHCESKNYQFNAEPGPHNIRLEVSNGFSPLTIINIYYKSNSIVIQGKPSQLKDEMEQIKTDLDCWTPPVETKNPKIIPGNIVYTIISSDLRKIIKTQINELGGDVAIQDTPDSLIEYRAKISRNGSSITITQYASGKLSIQGTADHLFHDICDQIETIINSPQKEVTVRVLKGIDVHKEIIDAQNSLELDSIEKAEVDISEKLDQAIGFLDMHDKKLIIASWCLCLSGIKLPDYTPFVMPASKAFEGYTKKLILSLGLISSDELERKKGINFKVLIDASERKEDICRKDKYANDILQRLSVCIKANRHYMMHSNDSAICNMDNPIHAMDKVNSICTDIRETFIYFNSLNLI